MVIVDKDAAAILKGFLAKVNQPIAVDNIKNERIEPKDKGK